MNAKPLSQSMTSVEVLAIVDDVCRSTGVQPSTKQYLEMCQGVLGLVAAMENLGYRISRPDEAMTRQ